MSLYNFKRIQVVPTSSDFIDIVLSKTQRKTPTVIHKGYSIGRIRQFYMRKVKFTQDTFNEKLNAILTEFPKLDDIHPFYADLMNVLYDKDHFKLALGQINTARHLIDQVAKDYNRLLKFGDSLYRCKQLKKAALGRMATIMKRQKDSLAYLEQVRQHLSRLPSIDPNTRTLLICGYPNVGKSSFMNKLTRADVDVQPYAFTTKSLFVGHMDYKYLRWQVIDTPGILDHPLEDRNTIEMQSITALAHLRACVMFFVDLSEQCGYSVKEQFQLYHSIKPLFANKPTVLVINKIDVRRPEDLNEEESALLQDVVTKDNVTLLQQSCFTDEGVMEVRNSACEKLLAARVEVKMKSQKVNDVLNKITVSQPKARDDRPRPAFIPPAVLERRAKAASEMDTDDMQPKRLERDIEAENGGAGVYNVDLKKHYALPSEFKYDVIPEIMDGKNIADFVDPDIEAKLDDLEREEEKLEAEGYYDDEEEEDEEDAAIREAAAAIRTQKSLIIQTHRLKKGKNRPTLDLKQQLRSNPHTLGELSNKLADAGVDVEKIRGRLASTGSKRKRSESRGVSVVRDASNVEDNEGIARSQSRLRDRSVLGLKNKKQKLVAESIKRTLQRPANMFARAGEADRAIQVKLPKHLFSGKRGAGKTDRR
ncbi:putative NOG1-nucleolar G-protein required for 60S ribosomal subunit biogenesis [Paraphysoderma sedebokerense]|nr:putative NOG1-nucleolar G-protein required for 60S ribosomal subunit biogenesis [Paraphysoderma sedebokerense]